MARKTLTFALLALLAITAHAQHFDWVKSYFGPDYDDGIPANEVRGSVMDSKGNVNITLVADGNAFVAYPNPFRQSVKIRVESGALKVENGVANAWLTDLTGRREQVRLTPDGPWQYSLDLTSRPQATYLLSLTTIGGKTHTIRLMKMSDIFSR